MSCKSNQYARTPAHSGEYTMFYSRVLLGNFEKVTGQRSQARRPSEIPGSGGRTYVVIVQISDHLLQSVESMKLFFKFLLDVAIQVHVLWNLSGYTLLLIFFFWTLTRYWSISHVYCISFRSELWYSISVVATSTARLVARGSDIPFALFAGTTRLLRGQTHDKGSRSIASTSCLIGRKSTPSSLYTTRSRDVIECVVVCGLCDGRICFCGALDRTHISTWSFSCTTRSRDEVLYCH